MSRDLQQLWQDQVIDAPPVSLQFVRERILNLHDRARFRRIFEYVVGVISVALAAWFVWKFPLAQGLPITRAGVVLTAIAAVYVTFRGHQLIAAEDLSMQAGVLDALTFYRRQLRRQIDIRRSARGYLLPFAPGGIVCLAAIPLEHQPVPWMRFGLAIAWTILWTAVSLWMIEKSARRLERELDALDSLKVDESARKNR